MKTNHNYYVYIVECKDDSYYTGITNDIERRLWEHNTGINKECYTYSRRPVELKYLQQFQQVEEAIKWEKQLKGWSRKKKQALFREDWEEIKRLAKSSTSSSNSTTLRQAQGDKQLNNDDTTHNSKLITVNPCPE